MDDAVKAKAELRQILGRPSWLRGIGISQDDDGAYFVKVNVSKLSDTIGIPNKLGDVPIKVEAVGDIEAQELNHISFGELDVLVDQFVSLAKPKWKKRPKGWSEKTVKDYWKSLTEKSEHPFTECVKKMKGKMKKPEGFCAKTKDVSEGTTEWRGKEQRKNKRKRKKSSK